MTHTSNKALRRFEMRCRRAGFGGGEMGRGMFFAASLALAASSFVGALPARSASPFYRGKTITIIVSYGPGGGYDTYARLVARRLGTHLDGSPTVVVENMSGAGGLVGANYLYNAAPRDGTTLGVINQSAAVAQVLGAPGIQYDSRKFNWIGRIASGVEVTYSWFTSPAKTIEEAKHHTVVIGGSGPTSTSEVLPRIMNQLIGTKFRLVSGYPDGAAGALALQRGEIEAYSTEWAVLKSRNADWLRDKKINPMVQYALERARDLPDVPTSIELGQNDVQRQIFTLMSGGDTVGRSLAAPPSIPDARVAELRAALKATVSDPAFIAEAKTARYEPDWMSGEQLAAIVDRLSSTPADVVSEATRLSAVGRN
jgi:tripartite-type tricarboxylate transporter receptor subunit TctC